MIDVSVVIPVHNQQAYIKQAIESCFDTNLQVEVVVLDDGSTDGTSSILQEMQEKHDNLIIITQAHVGNMGANLHTLYSRAQGKYVCELGSDDFLLPKSLDLLFATIEGSTAGLVYSGYHIMEDDKIINTIPHPDNKYYQWIKDPQKRLLQNNFVAPPCLVRRELYSIVQYDTTQKLSEDYLFKLELSRVTDFVQLKKHCGVLRKRPNSITYSPELAAARHYWDTLARRKVVQKYGR